MLPQKSFYMIRHGESIANRDGYFSGNLDVELTNTGKQQAERARTTFESLSIKPTIIIHSHLSRARDTASIINAGYQLPMIETHLLGEHHFGDWEKMPWQDVRPAFLAGQNPPNGESHEDFKNRCHKGFQFALKHEGTPLIVCHGGVFRGFSALYGKEMHGITNCTLYSFEVNESEPDFPWKITLIG